MSAEFDSIEIDVSAALSITGKELNYDGTFLTVTSGFSGKAVNYLANVVNFPFTSGVSTSPNAAWGRDYTLSTSATTTIALNDALDAYPFWPENPLEIHTATSSPAKLYFNSIFAIFLKGKTTNNAAGSFSIDPYSADGWTQGPWGAGKVTLPARGFSFFVADNDTGWPVTADTDQVIRLTNESATYECDLSILVLGNV